MEAKLNNLSKNNFGQSRYFSPIPSVPRTSVKQATSFESNILNERRRQTRAATRHAFMKTGLSNSAHLLKATY
jgi:hypothetical protein